MMVALNKNLDFKKLIPELEAWNNGKGIDVEDWIACEGDHKHLVGYARILWPDFVEHDGCIFLGSRIDAENYDAFLAQSKGDKKAVEAVMNHQHIVDLFSRSHHESPTREVVVYLGRLMREIWQTKLNHDFPGRSITVSFPEDNIGNLLDYQITFFQER
ncbi:MAG TPA: hypothetical protein VEH30_10215 [Terriglobales bacterium]|nr:hypothetical protein [Terriglobales bacterium]